MSFSTIFSICKLFFCLTIEPSGISQLTTHPAPITQLSPIFARCYPAVFTDFYDSCFAFAVYTACTEFMIVVKNIDVAPEKGIISDSDLTEAAQHTVVIKIHVASYRKRTAPIGYYREQSNIPSK